jgi:MoxR-like ATPase
MSSLVRNQLIDQVYLPLCGANLAKQLGATGTAKRTDQMGMLLLVSPPGYGKTTLMEYVAARLGLAFVKVNGPALGHEVTSLDPADAPNATARQEVEKISLALEMGTNVMLYLDDIQHTSPELLQKFISLCDAQRKIEGVWRGRTRTYDLRGKKFCIVMAGNPYTESGEQFRIPDMLANRADVYNLGEVLAGKSDAFSLSFLENALTSNPALAPLATRPLDDVYKLLRMAQGEPVPTAELSHGYSSVELEEILAVMRHLFAARKTLLAVNAEYIRSAAQADTFRTEPPFKLQGSYRNMNKIAERVVSALTPAELERLVEEHYQSESQTLTTAAEHNLLKLAELRGTLAPERAKRWNDIKDEYVRVRRTSSGDPMAQLAVELRTLREAFEALVDAHVAR